MTYTACRCPYSYKSCPSWFVDPATDTQGVRFTEAQARAVAALLNGLDQLKTNAADFIEHGDMFKELGLQDVLNAAGWEETERLHPHHIAFGWSRKVEL